MKRAFGILAALLLAACLSGAVLALTALRPRSEVVSTSFEEKKIVGVSLRKRTLVTRHWSLSPPWEWSLNNYGDYSPWHTDGWQYGPFVFVEKREFRGWPVGVEKAAHAVAVQKLGAKEPELVIQSNDSCLTQSWHVVASTPGGKRLEMDYTLTWDSHGEPHIQRQR